jgi:hypothetical protein
LAGQKSRRSGDFAASSQRILGRMEGSERDSTRDWLIPGHTAPPLFGELVQRIDEALAIAQASEKAVMTVGAAALDAAEHARRSAELAERASAAMLEDRRRGASAAGDASEDHGMRGFNERADRVVARLRALERLPA